MLDRLVGIQAYVVTQQENLLRCSHKGTDKGCARCSAQVFLSHLHSDHHADLASLYVGAMFGRREPWEVWGPSSEKPELGVAACIDGLRQVSTIPPPPLPNHHPLIYLSVLLHEQKVLHTRPSLFINPFYFSSPCTAPFSVCIGGMNWHAFHVYPGQGAYAFPVDVVQRPLRNALSAAA